MKSLSGKELIVFDLDGTLTESKAPLKKDMAFALAALLREKKVAVIGGGTYEQFTKQFVGNLRCPKELLSNLYLFPTTSTSFYLYKGGWKKVYRRTLSDRQFKQIKRAFEDTFKEINYMPPKKVYGKVIENRDTEVTFSALGQDIVDVLGKKGIRLKEKWRDENEPIKEKIAKSVQKKLPQFSVRRGGITSIDVTQKGIDKAYGIRQIKKVLNIPIKKMVFIGDALYPGGNDNATKKTGVQTISVKGPKDTIKVIRQILKGKRT